MGRIAEITELMFNNELRKEIRELNTTDLFFILQETKKEVRKRCNDKEQKRLKKKFEKWVKEIKK